MNEDDWPGTSQAFRKYTHIPTGDRRSLVRRDMAPLGRISEFPKGSVADKYMDIMYQKRVERKQQEPQAYTLPRTIRGKQATSNAYKNANTDDRVHLITLLQMKLRTALGSMRGISRSVAETLPHWSARPTIQLLTRNLALNERILDSHVKTILFVLEQTGREVDAKKEQSIRESREYVRGNTSTPRYLMPDVEHSEFIQTAQQRIIEKLSRVHADNLIDTHLHRTRLDQEARKPVEFGTGMLRNQKPPQVRKMFRKQQYEDPAEIFGGDRRVFYDQTHPLRKSIENVKPSDLPNVKSTESKA